MLNKYFTHKWLPEPVIELPTCGWHRLRYMLTRAVKSWRDTTTQREPYMKAFSTRLYKTGQHVFYCLIYELG